MHVCVCMCADLDRQLFFCECINVCAFVPECVHVCTCAYECAHLGCMRAYRLNVPKRQGVP